MVSSKFHSVHRFCSVTMEPVVNLRSLKRSRDLETDWTKCVFCQSGKKDMPLSLFSNDSLQRVQHVVDERMKYQDDNDILERLALLDLNAVFSINIIW